MTKASALAVIRAGVDAQRDDCRDRELFRLLAEGNCGALAEIYDRHGTALFRHAVALARSAADAEDLVQATLVKLATAGPSLLGVRRPVGYLHRVLHAAWIDSVRRCAVRREEALEERPSVDLRGLPHGRDPETAIDVRRALGTLAGEQREVVVLHLFDGFAFREIGRITGVSTFTAASRYRLAIERLRRLLGGA